MNRYLLILGFWALAVLGGCTRSEVQGEGDSWVELSAVADPSLNIKSTKADSYTIPLPADYRYTVRHAGDKTVVAQGESIAELGTLALMAGNYQFEVASVGEASLAQPSYAGSTAFAVQKGKTAAVEVKAKLSSAVVTVEFSDAVKTGFSSYKATISYKEGTHIKVFDATNLGALIYLPALASEVTCKIEVTSLQGFLFETTETFSDPLAAADLLSWTIDIPNYTEKPTDPLVVDMVLDRMLNEQVERFVVGLTQASGVPSITGRGIDLSVPVGVKLGVANPDALVDLNTKNGLAKVLMMFRIGQESLVGHSPQGLVDLMVEANRTAWGVSIEAGGTVGATGTLLNLSALTAKMPGPEQGAQDYFVSIGVLDLNGQYTVRELVFNVYGVSVSTTGFTYDFAQAIRWPVGGGGLTTATLRGRYNVEDPPEGMTFRYCDAGGSWRNTPVQYNPTTKEVWADAKDIAPNGQKVEYELYAGVDYGGVKSFVAAQGPQLADMDFEKMLTGKVDAGRWKPEVTPWGYSNPGKIVVEIPDNVTKAVSYNGTVCPQIKSIIAMDNFASGGLFSGYLDTGSGLIPDTKVAYSFSKVGVPFAARPRQLKGRYKYEGKKIDNYNNGSATGNGATNGGDDHFEIAVKLEKWGSGDYKTRWRDGFYGDPGSSYNGKEPRFATPQREQLAVGYGRLSNGESTDWKEFTIDINYSQSINPDRIIITAVSSAWGGYMTGGEGSTLWVDDLELVY